MDKTNKNRRPSATSLYGALNQNPIDACIRCGTCCTKGGPCFHHADKALIEKGVIHSRYLYTLRKGELAYDNIKDCLVSLDDDVIKLKGRDDSGTCIFFDEDQKTCEIYVTRPLECKALQCWDTRQLEAIYDKNRLTRKDLVSDIEGLWDLICDHQSRCDYDKIQELVNALNSPAKKSAQKQLIRIIQYDIEIRKLVVSDGGLEAEMLDFLFGRPLIQTIGNYGLRVDSNQKKIRLVPSRAKRNLRRCNDETNSM